MAMMRHINHVTETQTRIIFEKAVSAYSSVEFGVSEGDLVFRELNERDYGVDGELEIFENGVVTGKMARIQLKGTDRVIGKLKTVDAVSCPGVSKSSLGYCRSSNVPFILVYISKVDEKFYYCDLQPICEDALQRVGDGGSCAIRIPIENSSDNMDELVRIISSYYENDRDNRISGIRANGYAVKPEIDDNNEKVIAPDLSLDSFEDDLEDNMWDYPGDVSSYEIDDYQTPTDGEHRMVDNSGNTVKIGYWKDGELENGTEYNNLIRVVKGSLVFIPGRPGDHYDAIDPDDFEYEKLEMYHWETLTPFQWSEYAIAEVGMENCYVVDMEVDGDMEQLVNIRPLEWFMAGKNPRWLKLFKESIEIEKQEILEEGMEMNDTNSDNNKVNDSSDKLVEALLICRMAKLTTPNDSVVEVPYNALDLLVVFMESNYHKEELVSLVEKLSRKVLEKMPQKDIYWRYALTINAVPAMMDKQDAQELINVLRAYEMIDCDRDGLIYVTEKGKNAMNRAIIVQDEAKRKRRSI